MLELPSIVLQYLHILTYVYTIIYNFQSGQKESITVKPDLMIESSMIDSVGFDAHWQQNSPSENIVEKSIQEGSDTLSSNSNSFVIDPSNQRRNTIQKQGSSESPNLRQFKNDSEQSDIQGMHHLSHCGNSDDDSGFETIVVRKTDYGEMTFSSHLNIQNIY